MVSIRRAMASIHKHWVRLFGFLVALMMMKGVQVLELGSQNNHDGKGELLLIAGSICRGDYVFEKQTI